MTLVTDVGLVVVVALCIWFYWELERAGRR